MNRIELFKNPSLIGEIPDKAGVYIIYSEEDEILYVGKAKSLRRRLRSYLNRKDKDILKLSLLREACCVEFITLNNELEAFLLESNLIKQHRPPYNIVLRDDKSYPYLRISYSEKYPRLSIARRIKHKGDFYFGPITPVEKLRTLIKLLKSTFKIAQKNDKQCQGSEYPCIYYQMNRCTAPCAKKISREDYLKLIEQIKEILTNPSKIKMRLKKELKQCIDSLNFEKAIKIRDMLKAIEILQGDQNVSEINEDFLDVIGFAENDIATAVYVMSVRFKNIVGARSFFFNYQHVDSDFVGDFLMQYYLHNQQVIPDKIVLNGLESEEIVEKALGEIKTVKIIQPKKGDKAKLLKLAEQNAKINLQLYSKRLENNLKLLKKIQDKFNLEELPLIIDVADISHISFENVVGGVIRYKPDGFDKSSYRRYKLQSSFESEAMKELMQRHRKLILKSSMKLPDLIVVDGGIIQIKAAKEAFLNTPVIGIAKEKTDNRTKRGFNAVDSIYTLDGKIEKIDEDILGFFQKLRDEAHRFAVEYHRKKRKDYVLASALDRIEFIGPKRKRLLFEHFGSLENLKNASVDEIASIKGISKKIAMIIKERLNEQNI
ncbi:excinuclease ABC subunit UvrC [Hippea jasoniae]|uniref:excinuclease ABC subunit UvrC n=1 Tax=Hippea jasoniae TaxID=944479 RepID=UPI00068AD5B0|nr:excinuclease ABC subunit UvrC [Hippea jasoniae]